MQRLNKRQAIKIVALGIIALLALTLADRIGTALLLSINEGSKVMLDAYRSVM